MGPEFYSLVSILDSYKLPIVVAVQVLNLIPKLEEENNQ